MKSIAILAPVLALILAACAPAATPTIVPTQTATLAPTSIAPAATATVSAAPTATPNPLAPRITLNATQRAKLVALVNTDAEAKRVFDSIKRRADAALAESPKPIEKLQMAGKLESDPVMIASRASMMDTEKAYFLSIVFAVTGDAKYGAKAKEFVLAWARVNQPTGNPIDETNLDKLFFAYDLTRATFSPDELQRVDAWLRKIAEVEIASRNPRWGTATNNWNSHLMKIVGLISFLLPDPKLIEYTVNGYKQQIQDNLKPDGSTIDFHERDALNYHVYSIEPLLVLARVAQLNGVELYSYQAPSGAALPKSIAFLIPYADGTKTHAEYVNSTAEFDRARSAAGQAGHIVGTLFNPKQASPALEQNYFFDVKMLPLIIKINASNTTRFPTLTVLMVQAQR